MATAEQKRIVRTWIPLAKKPDGSYYWKGITVKKVRDAFKACRGLVQTIRDGKIIAVNQRGFRKSFDFCHSPRDPNRCNDDACKMWWREATMQARLWSCSTTVMRDKWYSGMVITRDK